MRRRQELKSRKLLSGPYLFWAASFIIIPLLMILYYGLTDKNGNFTLMNLAQITTQENLKALGLALLLSFVSTLICLILAYPLANDSTGNFNGIRRNGTNHNKNIRFFFDKGVNNVFTGIFV